MHCGDGVSWLRDTVLPDNAAIVTSLPDASELPRLGLDGWKQWFVEVSALACSRITDESVAVFFQTDVKKNGIWIDKSYLIQKGAEAAGSACLFHKIVCRAPPGTTTFGRPAYAHLMAFSRNLRLDKSQSSPDVLPELGHMPWARAMGVRACEATVRFLVTHTNCRVVVDPFCGIGTMLAVANQHGLSAVGVELSRKRAERAQSFELTNHGASRPVID